VRVFHPYLWVLACIGTVLCGVLGVLIAAYVALSRRWRTLWWPRERARRRTWTRALARVERAERVTQLGDFILVLGVRAPADLPSYREVTEETRWRRIVRLPNSAASHIEQAASIPILLPPNRPMTFALVLSPDATEAEGLARQVYIASGQLRWKLAAG
jgi:hypothetical protein